MSIASIASQSISKITKDMTIREIIAIFPGAADIMAEYGLHCFSCSIGGVETLQQGAEMHGFDVDTIEMLLVDINEEFAEQPTRPKELTITIDAARGIRGIAKQESHEGKSLKVMVDESGGFCMEFVEEPEEHDLAFFHEQEPDVRVYADVLTLQRIGGATIDVREGRFKLDLPENACCGGTTEGCGCENEVR